MRFIKKTALFLVSIFIFHFSFLGFAKAQVGTEWNMAGANPQRTGWVNADISGLTATDAGVTWYRPIEAYIDQKTQIVTGNRHVYVATAKGLIVLDAETGELAWRFNTDMPLSHTPAVVGNKVYIGGYDRKLYAFQDNGNSFSRVWTFEGAGSGYTASPLVVDNKVFIGNRDGKFYAVNTSDGSMAWSQPFQTGAPIALSAAFANNTVFFASNDMFAYALNSSNGQQVWKSQKLPGISMISLYPVIFNNSVIFSINQPYSNGNNPGGANIDPNTEFFGTGAGNITAGNSLTSDGSQGWNSGISLIDSQANTGGPNTLQGYSSQYPYRRVLVALNTQNGGELANPPFYWEDTEVGIKNAPVVNPNLAENALYLPNAYLKGGANIPRARVMGWKEGNRYLRSYGTESAIDEPLALSGAGNHMLQNLCCDRIAKFVTAGKTFWDYGPNPGLLDRVLPSQVEYTTNGIIYAPNTPNRYDPMWQLIDERLERLKGYYKGNMQSVNGVYGNHGVQNPLVAYRFTNNSGQTVQRLFTHKSNTIVAIGQTSDKTYKTPLLIDSSVDSSANSQSQGQLLSKLETEVDKILDAYESDGKFLNPGYANHGQWAAYMENYYYEGPGELLQALSMAYPHINASLKTRLQNYLSSYVNHYYIQNVVGYVGWQGRSRNNMDFPPDVQNRMNGLAESPGTSFEAINFYALSKYVDIFPQNSLQIYNAVKSRMSTALPQNFNVETWNRELPWQVNERIAGYHGFLNLQSKAYNGNIPASETNLRNQVQTALNTLQSSRSTYFNKDSFIYGAFDNPIEYSPVSGTNPNGHKFNIFRNFLFFTPELASSLTSTARTQMTTALNEYMYVAPYWFVAFHDNTFKEGAVHHMYDSSALFAAKAYLLNQSQAELSKYVDSPGFALGDAFYIQNLSIALSATGGTGPTSTPTPVPGDTNNDGEVDGIDYVTWLNHYNQSATPNDYSSGNFNNDNTVDGLDYVIWLNNYSG